MKNGVIPDVKKIAVLRANQLGDFVVALPALQALKNAYPEAELVLLSKPWTLNYLVHRPGPVDRVIAVPVSEGVRIEKDQRENHEEVMKFFAAMRRERFDIAVQLHGGGRHSNPFTKQLGARITAGLRTNDAEMLDYYIPYALYQNEVCRYLEVVALIGATIADVVPHVSVISSDIEEVKMKIPELTSKYIVLHPGASDPLRRWPPERFAQIGDALAQMGHQVVVTGIASEKEIVDFVIARMETKAVNACSKLSLDGLTGLLSGASLLISNDTGPLHLAHALGTKTVAIFWAHNIINWGPITSTGNFIAASWITRCPVCGKQLTGSYENQVHFPVCQHTFSLVSEVQTNEVLFYAQRLLGS